MHNANSQLVKTMFVWFFLSNVLFFTYGIKNINEKESNSKSASFQYSSRTINTFLNLSSILISKNSKAKDNIANL